MKYPRLELQGRCERQECALHARALFIFLCLEIIKPILVHMMAQAAEVLLSFQSA